MTEYGHLPPKAGAGGDIGRWRQQEQEAADPRCQRCDGQGRGAHFGREREEQPAQARHAEAEGDSIEGGDLGQGAQRSPEAGIESDTDRRARDQGEAQGVSEGVAA